MSVTLDEYRRKHAEWVEWLDGSDVHSVSSQVHTLNHDSAILRVVLRAVELSPNDDYGRPTIDPWFLDAILRWYTPAVCIGIRKLNEEFKASDKTKEVYSLQRLLSDMKANVHFVTRENVLQMHREHWIAASNTDEVIRIYSEGVEKLVDAICEVGARSRSTTDQMSARLLDIMLNRLEGACRQIDEYTNKYVAHAASPPSRQQLLGWRPTYQDIWKAMEIITRLTGLLVHLLCNKTYAMSLPRRCSDFAKPWVAEDDVLKLEAVVISYEEKVRSWQEWDTGWLSQL